MCSARPNNQRPSRAACASRAGAAENMGRRNAQRHDHHGRDKILSTFTMASSPETQTESRAVVRAQRARLSQRRLSSHQSRKPSRSCGYRFCRRPFPTIRPSVAACRSCIPKTCVSHHSRRVRRSPCRPHHRYPLLLQDPLEWSVRSADLRGPSSRNIILRSLRRCTRRIDMLTSGTSRLSDNEFCYLSGNLRHRFFGSAQPSARG